MSIKIEALQIAESFNIRKFREDFQGVEHFGTQSEIFFVFPETNRYLYLFDYGVIVFANYEAAAKTEMLAFAQQYTSTPIQTPLNEEYQVEINTQLTTHSVKNNFVTVPKITPSIMRIVTLNTGQSVALEYYETLTDEMITSSKHYILELERRGKLSISKTNLLKYIGKVLNVKNSVIDNLYILDDPNLVWDNEELNTLNRQLKANFEINTRFKDIDYRLQIIEDNLTLFTDVLNVRESSRLEWVIILLIVLEIAIALFVH
ncbi:RMD1 family protein [Flavobacterium sp.]|uniref:RMD1 family protein n=1 Tax=Flavobacterium sp. TaxID=239 RepID=UPI002FDB856B